MGHAVLRAIRCVDHIFEATGHAVKLRTVRCVGHIFEAAGPNFACICVFVTLVGRWAAVFILTFFCLFIICIGLQGRHASH